MIAKLTAGFLALAFAFAPAAHAGKPTHAQLKTKIAAAITKDFGKVRGRLSYTLVAKTATTKSFKAETKANQHGLKFIVMGTVNTNTGKVRFIGGPLATARRPLTIRQP